MTNKPYNADNVEGLEGAMLCFVDAFDHPPTDSPLDKALYAYIEAVLAKKDVRELAAARSAVVQHCEADAHNTAEELADLYIGNIAEAMKKYPAKAPVRGM